MAESEKVTRARVLRTQIEAMAQELDDADAADVPEFFPEWNPEGCAYAVGDRVRYEGTLYKIIQPHTSQASWTPLAAPSLFAEILPGQGGTEIGEWVQPDSTNPYMTGDRVIYEGSVYESTIDGNVWSPADYPQGWALVE